MLGSRVDPNIIYPFRPDVPDRTVVRGFLDARFLIRNDKTYQDMWSSYASELYCVFLKRLWRDSVYGWCQFVVVGRNSSPVFPMTFKFELKGGRQTSTNESLTDAGRRYRSRGWVSADPDLVDFSDASFADGAYKLEVCNIIWTAGGAWSVTFTDPAGANKVKFEDLTDGTIKLDSGAATRLSTNGSDLNILMSSGFTNSQGDPFPDSLQFINGVPAGDDGNIPIKGTSSVEIRPEEALLTVKYTYPEEYSDKIG